MRIFRDIRMMGVMKRLKRIFEYITTRENVKQQKYKRVRMNSDGDSIFLNEIAMMNHILGF